MYQRQELLFLYTQTGIQPGAGSGSGSIDRPVQREADTGFPLLQASGIRGAVRFILEANEKTEREQLRRVFGSQIYEDGRQPGSFAFTDAKVLLFPVHLPEGGFVWVTCPLALQRLARDSRMAEDAPVVQALRQLGRHLLKDARKKVIPGFCALPGSLLGQQSFLSLGDIALPLVQEELKKEKSKARHQQGLGITLTEAAQQLLTASLAWLEHRVFATLPGTALRRSLYDKITGESKVILVDDQVFAHVSQTRTQVEARIRLAEDGRAAAGALWREEVLPPEVFMYTVVMAADPALQDAAVLPKLAGGQQVLKWLKQQLSGGEYLQVGAGEGIGRGYCLLRWSGEVAGHG